MYEPMTIIGITIAIIVFFIVVFFNILSKFYRKVEQGTVLIVNSLRMTPEVITTGRMVFPIIHRAEVLDISLKRIEIARSGSEGLICQDNIRADIKVTFFIKVDIDQAALVAEHIGCARASNLAFLTELFSAKFSEALKVVGRSMDFTDLYQDRIKFRDEIRRQIGKDLSGFELSDVAIDYLEQTPLAKLDPDNIFDAEGIKKITSITAQEHIKAKEIEAQEAKTINEFQREQEMAIAKRDAEAREVILEQERRMAEAEAMAEREIESMQARKKAEAERIRIELEEQILLAEADREYKVALQQLETERMTALARLEIELEIAARRKREGLPPLTQPTS